MLTASFCIYVVADQKQSLLTSTTWETTVRTLENVFLMIGIVGHKMSLGIPGP